jgi:hypothetical protein
LALFKKFILAKCIIKLFKLPMALFKKPLAKSKTLFFLKVLHFADVKLGNSQNFL